MVTKHICQLTTYRSLRHQAHTSTVTMAAKNGVINLATFLGKSACPEASYMQAAVQYSTGGGVAAYKLPELPYGYSALGAFSLSTRSAILRLPLPFINRCSSYAGGMGLSQQNPVQPAH
jgi:hypothetical protein